MKIISWNIKRPKVGEKRNIEIQKIINEFDADIIFLTETNSIIDFPNYYKIQTEELPKLYCDIGFNKGENKTTIFSKYQIESELKTYDKFSSVCVKVRTELGELNLYGSIIGFTGGLNEYFKQDLFSQKKDLQELAKMNNLCFSGDLNISFSGRPYPSKKVRKEMQDFCESLNLEIITKNIENTAIHIIINQNFLENKTIKITEMQIENKISDHNLIFAEIENKYSTQHGVSKMRAKVIN